MPHRSVKVAEKAAIEGEVDEWDTQQCQALRDELLPSSPNRVSDQVASTSNQLAMPSSPQQSIVGDRHREQPREPEIDLETGAGTDAAINLRVEEDGNGLPDQLEEPAVVNEELNAQSANVPASPRPSVQYKRDKRGRIRPFKSTGEEYMPSDFDKKYQELAKIQTAMEDLTQRSSMSATQENPPYLYDQFNIQEMTRDDCPSTATPGDDDSEDQDPPATIHDPKHASASTAYTYQENDTGHIHLGFDTEPLEEEDQMEQSQDASYAIPAVQSHASFEPKTPAPPVNPFKQKGSVMKGFELFGATQPSSIGRHMASPTSSRPSPDVYNNFSSPPKRQTLMLSSPLVRGPELELESEANDATPLQSSVRNMLARSQSSNSKAAQSFDMGPRNTWANPEPRPYVSMKESQEKRRQTTEPDSDSSSDDSDIEATPRNRNRKLERELQIQKEIATVELRKGASTNPRSSAPASSTAAVDVEVPSTGRRRSYQDDYIAQCSGHDARDTQDDFIADSQAARSEVAENRTADDQLPSSRPSFSRPELEGATEASPSQPINGEMEQEMDVDPTQNANSSAPEPDMDPEPSLPLQEMLSNRSNAQTPNSKLQSDAAIDTVPETSPPEDRLRPMAEIASISFGASEELPNNFPGFSQDPEFDNAMQIRSSPKPPSRLRSFRRTPKSSSMTSSGIASPGVNTMISSVASSALSSPPNSAVLEEVEVEVSLQLTEEPLHARQEPSEEPKGREDTVQGDDGPKDTGEEDETDHHARVPLETPAVNIEAGAEVESESTSNEPPAAVEQQPGDLPEETADNTPTPSVSKQKPTKQAPAKRALKTYSRVKAPARSTPARASPRQSSRVANKTPAPKSFASPIPRSKLTASEPDTAGKTAVSKQQTSQPAVIPDPPSASFGVNKRSSKRKSGVTIVQDDLVPTRSSKRQSIAKDSSPDPLALSSPTAAGKSPKTAMGLFKDMTFAVSFVGHEREKDAVTKAIFDQGGRILPEGFDSLFESAKGDKEMSLSPSAKSVGFVALIADEHSRRAKYMQALALGLPCISGHWITACVAKNAIVDWSPYLLCAGQSSILGNAHKSRVLRPYAAGDAKFEDTFANREKLLEGKSILLITGKGKSQEKRKAYTFLAHALGPARISQVADYQDARMKLSQEQDLEWDLLYVDTHEKAAEAAVFGAPTATSSSASRKRKRGPTAAVADESPAPKKIRIISDETMIQSLILGQLLDD
ncbi:hypothetical protein IFR05_013848 [Cadophora sp. M221]|nr:hypothetical protein IFR05_013848 [Cadophora sp. M221]